MAKHGRSLAWLLTWRIVVPQALIMLAAFMILGYQIHHDSVSYVDPKLVEEVQASLVPAADGGITLTPTPVLRKKMDEHPALWVVARDESGHTYMHGSPPASLTPLLDRLAFLAASDIHGSSEPFTDTAAIRLVNWTHRRVHFMVGGAATSNAGGLATMVADYLTWRLLLPTVLATLITVPIVVRRSMKSVRQVARHADEIDVEKRGAKLADQTVPHEIQPLVRGFNAALTRVSEGYDVRDRFLASAAHELRAPIAILRARIDAMDPCVERTRLLGDTARLWNLAEQLLDLQRFNGDAAACQKLNLAQVASAAVADIAPLTLESGNDIEFDAPEGPVWIHGDALALSRVIMNLVQNAMVHADGQGTISVAVTAWGELTVTDQGGGIPQEERERIFEPFYRTRPSSTGTGLGLHLARQVVERHGGSIDVANAEHGGACFRVRLPRATA
ncbi:HAMP domain-containing histidine kinase [Luteibacter aegosomaticola]|uniref:sensor histidine kinase n=1 Tax=Luteibacter aegosomaticola TaxID=2911538 RepID=UPI001FF99AA6|nr:HAMP domain-containing sensor histidine kinase [Luteibacter aegosomaticola]UPG89861.1 HAMP domain-containing histidine kinase [Luteibacter aegosomaticola]